MAPDGVIDLTAQGVQPLLVIGAGRAALSFVTRLDEAALPGVLGACLRMRARSSLARRATPARRPAGRAIPLTPVAANHAAVVDAAGGWLASWAARMRRGGASHVRAPHTGVPFPAPLALRAFAERAKRSRELLASSPRFVAVPSLALYADFCADHLPRVPAARVAVRKATVVSLVRAHAAHAACQRARSRASPRARARWARRSARACGCPQAACASTSQTEAPSLPRRRVRPAAPRTPRNARNACNAAHARVLAHARWCTQRRTGRPTSRQRLLPSCSRLRLLPLPTPRRRRASC